MNQVYLKHILRHANLDHSLDVLCIKKKKKNPQREYVRARRHK